MNAPRTLRSMILLIMAVSMVIVIMPAMVVIVSPMIMPMVVVVIMAMIVIVAMIMGMVMAVVMTVIVTMVGRLSGGLLSCQPIRGDFPGIEGGLGIGTHGGEVHVAQGNALCRREFRAGVILGHEHGRPGPAPTDLARHHPPGRLHVTGNTGQNRPFQHLPANAKGRGLAKQDLFQ